MPDICDQLTPAIKDRAKQMIQDAVKTGKNQNALISQGKVISVVSGGRMGHRIAGEGDGILYAPAPVSPRRTTLEQRAVAGIPQTLAALPSDLVEMITRDRPFSCRAQELFGMKKIACFEPDEPTFSMADRFLSAIAATEEDFNRSLQYWTKEWGEPAVPHKENRFEMAMYREIMMRRARGRDLFKTLAPEALEKCEVSL